ncbi:MAG: bifunctional phosphoribosylaminoimidazolecarboxamide formyltransferase/IMP cyclohydrolase [Firmicutes bacterium]|nr:bifunctional phosphoribosylaminoimidazolecarboxamide formyltransferase/IMP cyclohydrolase [Bacillota bacterium]
MDVWALMSLSDKTGAEELARDLQRRGYQILATQSTAQYLRDRGLPVTTVESLTGFGEVLSGRVKTLHPLIYAGLLATDQAEHQAQRQALGAPDIRVVAVNLYPFESRWREGASLDALIEEIDIGGVSLIRAAAKNFRRVTVLTSPAQYRDFVQRREEELTASYRQSLAVRALYHVAYYDAVIARALAGDRPDWPDFWALPGIRGEALRYGENPHQDAALYWDPAGQGFAKAELLQGKTLSYNNYADADTAIRLAYDFDEPAAVVVKHQTPAAAALGSDIREAYRKAAAADPVSIFGGVVAVNRPIDRELAEALVEVFLEVVLAPEVSEEAKAILGAKRNLRVLRMPPPPTAGYDVKAIWGGVLVQPADFFAAPPSTWKQVAGPDFRTRAAFRDLDLAWKTVARVKSNAIVVAKDGVTVGIGGGQTNRVDAARQALERAGSRAQGAVLASDGFFPFDDVMRLAQERGIAVVVQPGGSIRDQDSVAVAEAAGISLLITGERHFRH